MSVPNLKNEISKPVLAFQTSKAPQEYEFFPLKPALFTGLAIGTVKETMGHYNFALRGTKQVFESTKITLNGNSAATQIYDDLQRYIRNASIYSSRSFQNPSSFKEIVQLKLINEGMKVLQPAVQIIDMPQFTRLKKNVYQQAALLDSQKQAIKSDLKEFYRTGKLTDQESIFKSLHLYTEQKKKWFQDTLEDDKSGLVKLTESTKKRLIRSVEQCDIKLQLITDKIDPKVYNDYFQTLRKHNQLNKEENIFFGLHDVLDKYEMQSKKTAGHIRNGAAIGAGLSVLSTYFTYQDMKASYQEDGNKIGRQTFRFMGRTIGSSLSTLLLCTSKKSSFGRNLLCGLFGGIAFALAGDKILSAAYDKSLAAKNS